MPYLRDFADNSIMKENLGKKIRGSIKDHTKERWMSN
jgi:hypothetical protein